MGKRYEQHDSLCGCERCAYQYEQENPRPVFDVVDDPDYLDCGCYKWSNDCHCYDYMDYPDGEE